MADDKKGMLRHVDVLGRVVIPREVRKALRIKYGDLMEFCACSNNQVVMRKFHLIREIAPMVSQIVNIARINNNYDVIITDTEKVVCWNGNINQEFDEIGDNIREMIEVRKPQTCNDLQLSNSKTIQGESILQPIICNGDVLGAVVVSEFSNKTVATDSAKLIAEFLANNFGN